MKKMKTKKIMKSSIKIDIKEALEIKDLLLAINSDCDCFFRGMNHRCLPCTRRDKIISLLDKKCAEIENKKG